MSWVILSSTSVDSSESVSSSLTWAGVSSAGLRMNLRSITLLRHPNVAIVGVIGNDLSYSLQTEHTK